MIYLDTSVALAQLLGEDRRPPTDLWNEPLISSRLIEYEVWNRIHARRLPARQHEAVTSLLEQVSLVELSPVVLERALQPFPTAVRTLDALHLATMEYLVAAGHRLRLASFDERLNAAAAKMKLKLYPLR